MMKKNQFCNDYYYLGLKTAGGDQVMVYLSTVAMGWSGELYQIENLVL